jgi:hypothetical protein
LCIEVYFHKNTEEFLNKMKNTAGYKKHKYSFFVCVSQLDVQTFWYCWYYLMGLGHLGVIRLLGLGHHGPGPGGITGRGSESEARSPQSLTARPFGLDLPCAGVQKQNWTLQIGPYLVCKNFLKKHCSTFRLYLTGFVQSWIN